jgi:2TM domain
MEITMPATLSYDAIEDLARKRAGAKLGWFIHASVYVLVNTFLMLTALYHGKAWAFFPLMGWGLGLAIHGAAVWFASSGSALHERLLARERARLQAQRDPW